MSRAALAVLFLFLLLPGTALAQTDVPLGPGPAQCLADAGAGRTAVVREADDRLVTEIRDAALDLEATVTHEPGPLFGCPAVATAANGAAVVATARYGGRRVALDVSLREPGGTFAAPVRLLRARRAFLVAAAAIAPDGAAVVAWMELTGGTRMAVRVARRAPGGAFGPVETLTAPGAPRYLFTLADVAVGMDRSGRATVAWVAPQSGDDDESRAAVQVTTAAPGQAFGAPQALGVASELVEFSLAVAPDGRALLAHHGDGRVSVYERAPGGVFAALARFGTPPSVAENPAVALAGDGSAVVSWTGDNGAVFAATRSGASALGGGQRIGTRRSGPFSGALFAFSQLALEDDTTVILAAEPPRLRAVAGPGGRSAVAWLDAGDRRGSTIRARVASPGGGDAAAFGGPVRDVAAVLPVLTPSGPRAIWLDNRAGQPFALTARSAAAAGRLRLGAPGVVAADPAPPELTVAARPRRLYHGQPLPLTVTCSAACEVRGTIAARKPGDRDDSGPQLPAIGVGGRDDAGAVRLKLQPGLLNHLAPPPPGSSSKVPVVVTATAPGGTRTTVVEHDVRVTRRPVPPLLRPLDVRAVRRGDDVVVTWRTRRPARRQRYAAETLRARGQRDGDRADVQLWQSFTRADGRRTRYRIRLREVPGSHRFVRLVATGEDPPERRRVAVVAIEG